MSLPPSQLDYAPRDHAQRRWRIVRWVIIAFLVATLLPVAIRVGRAGYERMRLSSNMRACLAYQQIGIVYEDAKQSLPPEHWTHVTQRLEPSLLSLGTLFLHERATPDGRRCLVGVDLSEIRRGQPLIALFTIRVYEPASTFATPRTLAFDFSPLRIDDRDGHVRITGGTIDPADASHFTIAYTVSGRAGVIDGWVMRDASVKLEERNVPPAP